MIPTSLRAHNVIKGLVALATAKLPRDVTVINGPARSKVTSKKVLLIGWDPNSPVHVASRRGESEITGRVTETGEIACYIATASGNADMDAAREAAVGILTTLEKALRTRENHTLDGSCDHAEIGPDMGMWQHQTTQDGASVGLPFSVMYEAFI